jgi:hypothetical protein
MNVTADQLADVVIYKPWVLCNKEGIKARMSVRFVSCYGFGHF